MSLIRNRIIGAILIASAALNLSQPVLAKTFHSLPELEREAEIYLSAKIGEAGGQRAPIDRRLKLSKCPEQIEWRHRGNNMLIGQCKSRGWRIPILLVKPSKASPVEQTEVARISRGQPVLLLVRKNGFSISRQMIADRAGKTGDLIPVRAHRKAAPVIAKIIGPGRVSVIGFENN